MNTSDHRVDFSWAVTTVVGVRVARLAAVVGERA